MNKKSLFLIFPALFSTVLLTSCGAAEADKVTKIYLLHQEDYLDETLIDDFNALHAGDIKVIFEKSETNETVYNELKTGKANYNLVTVSEYMIQRLASEKLIQKIYLDEDSIYNQNVSHWLTHTNEDGTKDGMIDKIAVKSYENPDEILGYLSEYTAGYMWGTLGTVVNPYLDKYKKSFKEEGKDYNPLDVVELLRGNDGWSSFWNPKFKGTHSIKDSMRDTYALGIFEVFKDKFLSDNYDKQYKNDELFNRHDEETINQVKKRLIDVKGNIFGFEVDSGKNDIVTKKIGMNLAWSGDAAFSILQGEYWPGEDDSYEEEKLGDDKTILYYNIPKIGSNVWFDGFAMPVGFERGSKEYNATLEFIDFISSPESAVRNMSTTGYTSFMAGNGMVDNPIVDYVLESFDEGAETPGTEPYDITYFFNNVQPGDMKIYTNKHSFSGRTLVAQYPRLEDTDHLYIMEDYGEDNAKIVQMWEDVKVNPLPIWIIVLLVVFVVLALGYLGSYKIIKAYKVRKRKSLRK